MQVRLASFLMIAACGYPALPKLGGGSDGAPGDGSGGGSGDGSSSATDCLQRWFDGGAGLAFSTPQEINTMPGSANDRDPWISADGFRLYFDRNPGEQGKSDIYFASRPSLEQDFAKPSLVGNLDTFDNEERASLNGDETLLVFSGDHSTSGGQFQLFVSKRSGADPFPSPSVPDQMLVAGVNINNNDYFDPFLTKDGLRLYLAPSLGGAPQQIVVATRTSTEQNFSASVPVPVINSGSGDANPSVTRDDRILVFSSRRPPGVSGLGGANLWYATRQSPADDFSTPQLIPTVNGNAEDDDPMLSADGCDLYFSSTRNGGKYHLFHASMTR